MPCLESADKSTDWFAALSEVGNQLKNVIAAMNADDYRKPLQVLDNQSIGKHVRHILENFEVLESNYNLGIVNYDKRKRNIQYEIDNKFACDNIDLVLNKISSYTDKTVEVTENLDIVSEQVINSNSSFLREVFYNLDHMIHHMAIIKIAIKVEQINVEIPNNFGVSNSTLKFQQQLVSANM